MTAAVSARRIALLFGALGVVCLGAQPVYAQVPVLEDPLEKAKEVVNETAGQAQDVLDEAAETVEETAKQVDKQVEETADDVDQVVQDVKKAVDVKIDPPLTRSPADPPNGSPVTPKKNNREPTREGPRQTVPIAEVRSERTSSNESFSLDAVESDASRGSIVNVPDDEALASGPSGSDAPPTPGETARRLTFPLLMMVLVVGFLAVQGRFDRRDPKLLFQVDVDGERLGFE